MNHRAGLLILGKDDAQKFFTKFNIRAECCVLPHRFLVCRSERGFDVGEDVAEEVEVGEVLLDVFVGFGADGFEAGADAIPAGKIKPGLGPGENPGDGTEVFQ